MKGEKVQTMMRSRLEDDSFANDPVINEKANMRFSTRHWIINGIMFVIGKRRRVCLRSLPLLLLLLVISISLQPSFHQKILYPLLYSLSRSFAFYTWLSRLAIYNYDGWEQNEYSLCRVNERRWWLYSILLLTFSMQPAFSILNAGARLIAWLSDKRRPWLVIGVFDLLEDGMHRVTSFFLVFCLDSSRKTRYVAKFGEKGAFFCLFLSLKQLNSPKNYFEKNTEKAQKRW